MKDNDRCASLSYEAECERAMSEIEKAKLEISYADLKLCPFCGGNNREYISAVGGEYVGLILGRYGSISPCVCLDCGIVYIPKEECERINRRVNNV